MSRRTGNGEREVGRDEVRRILSGIGERARTDRMTADEMTTDTDVVAVPVLRIEMTKPTIALVDIGERRPGVGLEISRHPTMARR
jgi:hypothetical protein